MKEETKQQILSRLRRIEGQIRGLQRMVEEDRYCIDILTQMASTTAALYGIRDMLMTQHLETCVAASLEHYDPEVTRERIDEVMTIFSRFRK